MNMISTDHVTGRPSAYHKFEGDGFFCLRRGCSRARSDSVHVVDRYDSAPTGKVDRDFAINNNLKPWFARRLMKTPGLEDFFELRDFDDSDPTAFDEFNRANPWFLRALRDLALDLKARGHKRYSIAGLFEVIRWRVARGEVEE